MEAKLRVIAGPFPGETIQVSAGKLLIGRAADCDVHVKSEFVSGRHCELLLDEHVLRIHDLGSKNGTLVNGRRIGTAPIILLHDDIVSIGDIYFLVDVASVMVPDAPHSETDPKVPPVMLGTEVFNGDTVQSKMPAQGPPQPESIPAPAPPPPTVSASDESTPRPETK
jgi:pSer/pThr/pTyr-binding forkhead associated (FHA) protein